MTTETLFFATPATFRAWLKANHTKARELWVGFYRKASGRPSITWPESVDEALCVGWIDGLRKSIGSESYRIRFTSRTVSSTWSALNRGRAQELIRQGRMLTAGLRAFERRTDANSGTYSYENRKAAVLSEAAERQFRFSPKAWRFFQSQPEGYRKTAIWWVVSAKKEVTRQKRLEILIAESEAGRRIGAVPLPAKR